MKTNNKNYSKLTVEEIIVKELDNTRNIESYMYLPDADRQRWRVQLVKRILSVRRFTSWIMVLLDLCMYAAIGSAIFHSVIGRNKTTYCIIAVVALIVDRGVKLLIDRIEVVYIQKTVIKMEKKAVEYFSIK